MSNLTNVQSIPRGIASQLAAAEHDQHDRPDVLCPICRREVQRQIRGLDRAAS